MNYLDFMSSVLKLHQKMIEPVSKTYGMTSAEMTVLLFLANNPEYDTATDIVQKRHLVKSQVSTSVRSLEEKGMLRREYRDGDRRTVHLILEAEGKKIAGKGQEAQMDFYRALSNGIPDSDLENLGRILEKMNGNVLQALNER